MIPRGTNKFPLQIFALINYLQSTQWFISIPKRELEMQLCLCSLVNALISAIAHPNTDGIAEVFCGDAEVYEVVVNLVTTHDQLSPLPYQNHEVI